MAGFGSFRGLGFGSVVRQTRSSFSPRRSSVTSQRKKVKRQRPVDLSPKHLAYAEINRAARKALRQIRQRR